MNWLTHDWIFFHLYQSDVSSDLIRQFIRIKDLLNLQKTESIKELILNIYYHYIEVCDMY